MFDLRQGVSFGFRYHRWWQFWKRGYGAAQVVAIDAAILHLRIFGRDGSVIAHLPINEAAVQPSVYQLLDSVPIPDGLTAMSDDAVQAWRDKHGAGVAGVFTVRLAEALDAIFDTVPPTNAAIVIESAYPVSKDGHFKTVRVLVAGG